MSRPKKTNADYFPHDANMRSNRKVRALLSKYGPTGYAILCMFLEVLANADNFKFELDEVELELLSHEFFVDSALLKNILNDCVKYKILSREGDIYTSQKLTERLKPLIDRRQRETDYRRRKGVENPVNHVGNPVNHVENPVNHVGNPLVKYSKVKESKVKESKEEKKRKTTTAEKGKNEDKKNEKEKLMLSILLSDNSYFGVTSEYFDALVLANPQKNVLSELRRMQLWVDANPKNRKTKKGIKRFITNWLSREYSSLEQTQSLEAERVYL